MPSQADRANEQQGSHSLGVNMPYLTRARSPCPDTTVPTCLMHRKGRKGSLSLSALHVSLKPIKDAGSNCLLPPTCTHLSHVFLKRGNLSKTQNCEQPTDQIAFQMGTYSFYSLVEGLLTSQGRVGPSPVTLAAGEPPGLPETQQGEPG